MTPEAQQSAIAEACGHDDRWVLVKRSLYYRPGGSGYTSCLAEAWIVSGAEADKHVYPHDEPVTKRRAPLPDYLGDLNAMHDAEKTLTEEQCESYFDWLNEEKADIPDEYPAYRYVIHATAAQRAEAFLRALGKWTKTTAPGGKEEGE